MSIGVQGILRALKPFSEKNGEKLAICEYIWNGFDADANIVKIDFHRNESNKLRKITIQDNGKGIPKDQLVKKFKPFLESGKINNEDERKNHSLPHGFRGRGRLTFFSFARNAKWTTVYNSGTGKFTYNITINDSRLSEFSGLEETPIPTDNEIGTSVEFSNLDGELDKEGYMDEIEEYLRKTYSWFLELTKSKNFKIFINGKILNYNHLIYDREQNNWTINGVDFNVRLIIWNCPIEDQSKYYLINSNGDEIFKDFTGLNRRGDGFYHSIFIESKYFDNFSFMQMNTDQQTIDNNGSKSDDTYKKLMERIDLLLRRRRKPYLKEKAKVAIKDLENEGSFISIKKNDELEKMRREEVKNALEEMYVIEPRIFSNLNSEQKKTLVSMFSLLMDSAERDNLFNILNQIFKLEPEERKELTRLLENTSLSFVIRTLNMITDRYLKVECLRKIIFEDGFNAREVEHLQELVESMPWFFGEQYSVYASVEDDFKDILLKIRKEILGEDDNVELDDPDAKKQVDLYLFGTQNGSKSINNLIIELKKPSLVLGNKELDQIYTYSKVIMNDKRFNGNSFTWEFILIGSEISEESNISGHLESNQNHGDGVVLKRKNQTVYVKKWSDLFNEFILRHEFITKELRIKRVELTKGLSSAGELVDASLYPVTGDEEFNADRLEVD